MVLLTTYVLCTLMNLFQLPLEVTLLSYSSFGAYKYEPKLSSEFSTDSMCTTNSISPVVPFLFLYIFVTI